MQPQPIDTDDIDAVPIESLERWSGYWRTLYARKRKLHDVSPRQIILGQVFTLVLTMAAGIYISRNKEALQLIGTTFIIYPVLADSLSSNATVLTASLHHELDSITGSKILKIAQAVGKSLLVATIASTCLGIAAGGLGILLFDAVFTQAVLLATLTGLVTALIGFPIMVLVMALARRMQANPDDVAPPVETTIFNTVTLVVIVIASRMLT